MRIWLVILLSKAVKSSFEKQTWFKVSLTLSVGLWSDISSSGRYSVDQFDYLLCNLLAHLLNKGISNQPLLVQIHVLAGRDNSMILDVPPFLLTLQWECNVKNSWKQKTFAEIRSARVKKTWQINRRDERLGEDMAKASNKKQFG